MNRIPCENQAECPLQVCREDTLSVRSLISATTKTFDIKNVMVAPSKSFSVFVSTTRDTIPTACIDNSIRNIFKCNKFCGCTIGNLLPLGSPTAILRRVISVVVDAVKCMFRGRFFAQIFKKCRETFEVIVPSITNLDTSTTISVITSVFSVVASFAHSTPRIIFRFVYSIPTMPIVRVIGVKPIGNVFPTHRVNYTMQVLMESN